MLSSGNQICPRPLHQDQPIMNDLSWSTPTPPLPTTIKRYKNLIKTLIATEILSVLTGRTRTQTVVFLTRNSLVGKISSAMELFVCSPCQMDHRGGQTAFTEAHASERPVKPVSHTRALLTAEWGNGGKCPNYPLVGILVRHL